MSAQIEPLDPRGTPPSTGDVLDQFRTAIVGAGLEPPIEIVADGNLHRFSTNGQRDDKAGFYVLHLDGLPAGMFGCWRLALKQTWHASTDRELSPEELHAHRERIEAMRRARNAEEAERHRNAAEWAARLLRDSTAAPVDHPYLARKGIQPHDLHASGDTLLVPMYVGDKIVGVQMIEPDGSKRFAPGTRTIGAHFMIGNAVNVLFICEGFATGASVHEATGQGVVIAFSASNLAPVAAAMSRKFPMTRINIAGDNDASGVGQRAAIEAAQAVGGTLAIPATEGLDWNDVHQADGLDAVRSGIEAATMPAPSESDVDASDGSEISAGQGDDADPHTCTRFPYGEGCFEVRTNGIYFVAKDKEGDPVDVWLSSPLHVTAKTRDANSSEWGRLLEWSDDDRKPHKWAMAAAMLQGDCIGLRQELASGGLQISPTMRGRNLLSAFIQIAPVEVRARCVKRLGWHGSSYVTADAVYGPTTAEMPVFQSEAAVRPESSARGTLEDWREHVASLAQGNSRLVLALCIALAGPLLELAGEDSGGFHLRGSSSTGKTTALRLAASVWGEPTKYVRTWRATSNGLEGIAAIHNDSLLILDELHQCDPREAGETAYMLANGQGKSRASRTGTARAAQSWRLLFLSSGEQSLAARLASVGRQSTAGQEVRLSDIPADTGRGMGIIQELHGAATSGDLIARLTEEFSKYHGAVGRAWLERLATDRDQIGSVLRANLDSVTSQITEGTDASGQASRVARRFALVALSGDLATRYGMTGWLEGEALDAAQVCFRAWLEGFGTGGDREERALLEQVRGFIEAHGGSRFEPVTGTDPERGPVIRDRVGFFRTDATGAREYLVLPEQFKTEVAKGFDLKWAAKVLAKNDFLLTQADRTSCVERIPALGGGGHRVYVLTAKAAGGGA